jgi:parallel beta-helix repeat protein
MPRLTRRRARLRFEQLEPRLALATVYVATTGSDTNNGSSGAPWRTLQKAASSVNPGDTVIVRAGNYAGFDLQRDGTPASRIVFSAEPGVLINAPNARTPDGINLEGADFVTIQGFSVVGMPRTGIRSVTNNGVIIRNNRCDQNGTWGILTGFSENVTIENNECSRSAIEHGIYVSNSADRPIVRGNVIWGNYANGLHMNGDINAGGGDGIITGALVENNIIYDNGLGGGSGINCDGVRSSRFQNNLLYENHAGGITLYRIDGGGASTGNIIVNNTVVQGETGRWALNILNASTGNIALNNIFYNEHPWKGSINCDADSLAGFVSNYNVVMDRFSTNDGESVLTFAQWRAATGQDMQSFIAAPLELFVSHATNDYQLKSDSPAIDVGTALQAPQRDLVGNPRPSGAGIDIGAFERRTGTIGTPANDIIFLRASADGTLLDVYNTDPTSGSPVLRWPMNSTQPLAIETLAGDDQLIVQLPPGRAGPPGGVRYLAGDGVNTLLVASGIIVVESSATGLLETIVADGARLSTSRLDQDVLTLLGITGRVTLQPGGGTSLLKALDFLPIVNPPLAAEQVQLLDSVDAEPASDPVPVPAPTRKAAASLDAVAARASAFRSAVDQAIVNFDLHPWLRAARVRAVRAR